jgi:hypothetical protein
MLGFEFRGWKLKLNSGVEFVGKLNSEERALSRSKNPEEG